MICLEACVTRRRFSLVEVYARPHSEGRKWRSRVSQLVHYTYRSQAPRQSKASQTGPLLMDHRLWETY